MNKWPRHLLSATLFLFLIFYPVKGFTETHLSAQDFAYAMQTRTPLQLSDLQNQNYALILYKTKPSASDAPSQTNYFHGYDTFGNSIQVSGFWNSKNFHIRIFSSHNQSKTLSGRFDNPSWNESSDEYLNINFDESHQCQSPAIELPPAAISDLKPNSDQYKMPAATDHTELAVGPSIITYRLAMATSARFTSEQGGKQGASEKIRELVNDMNLIYIRDFAIQFQLIPNNDILINEGTDPYLEDGDWADLDINQTFIDSKISNSDYDIGHAMIPGVTGWGAKSICTSNGQAKGMSFNFSALVHEMGHQFGAPHSCEWEKEGHSIMCRGPDSDYFVNSSWETMVRTSRLEPAHSCGERTNSGNQAPLVKTGIKNGTTFPINTPFKLVGSANDETASNDLLYSWEQNDKGAALFRNYFPTSDQYIRYFPKLENLIVNKTSGSETLPTSSRSLTFRLMVRDNNPVSGGVDYVQVQLNSTDQAGPFEVLFPGGENLSPNNLALSGSATEGSVEYSEAAGQKAIDGDMGTRWSSGGNNRWLLVDLKSVQNVDSIAIHWEAAYADQFKIESSEDQLNWNTYKSITQAKGGVSQFNPNINARYLRLTCEHTTPYPHCSVYEWEIFKAPAHQQDIILANTKPVIRWDVANTDQSPVNTAMVNILLSQDGGKTYPITLLNNTPNDGEAEVDMTPYQGEHHRIMVEAVDNVFFAISKSDFVIEESTSHILTDQTSKETSLFNIASNGSNELLISPGVPDTQNFKQLEILNVQGQIIGTFPWDHSQLVQTIPVTHLNSGAMTLRIKNKDQSSMIIQWLGALK